MKVESVNPPCGSMKKRKQNSIINNPKSKEFNLQIAKKKYQSQIQFFFKYIRKQQNKALH